MMVQHENWCFYPSDPCCCWVENKNERRNYHKSYCGYPKEPCSCGLEEAKRGERK